MLKLKGYQKDAISRMHNGCILCGGVGSGKSLTALAYFYQENGGDLHAFEHAEYIPMDDVGILDLYIITTARKRDTLEWDGELVKFLMSKYPEHNLYHNKIVIDSWNNIKKYTSVKDSFFIFDEDRVTGTGAWVKAFLKIVKANNWIILSATPGDKWEDYIPVFVANGFYHNITEFKQLHFEYDPYAPFPSVKRIHNQGRLQRLRNKTLVTMDFQRPTTAHHENIICDYDNVMYKMTVRNRWDYIHDEPIDNAPAFCQSLRRVVNMSNDRVGAVIDLLKEHPKVIIFYNYDYELELLRKIAEDSWFSGYNVTAAEWNGHKHEEIPETDSWMYLVQYNAGSEGWNCVLTDTIIFYSENYSYKQMTQAAGRIDRMNTPFTDLYYYHLKSKAPIDLAIAEALKNKKTFNESAFIGGFV